jgi:hypothetical protein
MSVSGARTETTMPNPKDKPLFCSQAQACKMFDVSLPTLKKRFVATGKLTPVYFDKTAARPRPHFSLVEIDELHDATFAKAKVEAARAKNKRRA